MYPQKGQGIMGGGFRVGVPQRTNRQKAQLLPNSPRALVRGDVRQGVILGDYYRGRNGGALREDYAFQVEPERLIPVKTAYAQKLMASYLTRNDVSPPPLPAHGMPVTDAVNLLMDRDRMHVEYDGYGGAYYSAKMLMEPNTPPVQTQVDRAWVTQRPCTPRGRARGLGPTVEDIVSQRIGQPVELTNYGFPTHGYAHARKHAHTTRSTQDRDHSLV